MEVETIFVDETEIGDAPGQGGTRDVYFTVDVRLQPAHERFDTVPDAFFASLSQMPREAA